MAEKRRQAGPNDGRRRAQYRPTVVEDFTVLDAAIASFLGPEESRKKSTRRTDQSLWKRWQDHCAWVTKKHELAVPIDPMDAPWFAFEDLFGVRKRGDTPLAVGYVEHIAAQVALRYGNRTDGGPRIAPYQRPENDAKWHDLLEAARRQEAWRREQGDPPREKTPALMREQLLQMLAAQPPRTARQTAFLALVLLALDTDLPAPRLQALEPGDVELLDNDDPSLPGGIWVAGMDKPLACDHRERVRGVPHDCTACAVRAVLVSHPGHGALFIAGPSNVAGALHTRRKAWPYLETLIGQRGGSALTPLPHLTADPDRYAWELAGLRRGLALGAGHEEHVGFMWVRARAWTAAAWVAGFRMISDLSALGRDRVETARNGEGFLVRLCGTKDDAPGRKRVIRPLEWSATDTPSAAQAMAEYLAVRDAAVGGRTGALLLTTALYGHRPVNPTATSAAEELNLLCKFARLPEGVYSSYSTRKGYGAQATADGWDVEDIAAGLRHQRLDTTRLYTGDIDGRAVVQRMITDEPEEAA